MPPVRLVLDSNSYFRLARSIRPLLDASFGPEPCRLAVLKELDEEFNRSTRLQSKFFWVREPEYQQDRRKGLPTPSTNDKAKIIRSRLFVSGLPPDASVPETQRQTFSVFPNGFWGAPPAPRLTRENGQNNVKLRLKV